MTEERKTRRAFLGTLIGTVVGAVVTGAGVWALTPKGEIIEVPKEVTKTTTVTEAAETVTAPAVTKEVTKTTTVTKTVAGPPAPAGEVNYITTAHCKSFYESYILNRFTELTGIKVNPYVEGFGAVHDKLATTFASGVYTYDVVYTWGGWLPEFHEFIAPLDELGIEIPEELEADMMPYSKNTVYWRGHWYGLPRLGSVFVLHANPDHLAEVGFSFPESFEEWIECMDALKKKYKDVKDYYPFAAGYMQGYSAPHWWCWLHCNGGSMWDTDDRRTIISDSEAGIKAAEDMALLYKEYMNPAAGEWIFGVQAAPAFFLEKASFIMYHPPAASIEAHAAKFGYPIKRAETWLIPGHKGVVRSGSMEAMEGYAIPKLSKNVEAGWKLIQYLNSQDVQVYRILTNGPEPPQEEDVSPMWSHYADPRIKAVPWAVMMCKAELTQLKYKCSRYSGRPAYQAICTALEAELANAIRGVKTPEDAMKDAAEACDKLVDEEYAKFGGGWWDPWEEMKTPALQRKVDETIAALEAPLP